MSILQNLTEGLVNRDLAREGEAILNKWEATGLLEGLTTARSKESMSLLLENQAKQLLKEASSMAAGDVEGFASVAFPIVRRVFANLLANDLVSVQPMSLPSGLIFFLDFTHETGKLGAIAGASLYGGNVVASQLTGGVDLVTNDGGGFYNMGNAYSSPFSGSAAVTSGLTSVVTPKVFTALTDADKKNLRYDPDLLTFLEENATVQVEVAQIAKANVLTAFPQLNVNALHAIDKGSAFTAQTAANVTLIRRLTRFDADGNLLITVHRTGGDPDLDGNVDLNGFNYPLADKFAGGSGIGSVAGQDIWGLEEPLSVTNGTEGQRGNVGSTESKNEIPEIDIKVDSIAVTAVTKKLKAKWSQELGQDLSAYHNLDAEVELTGILSEQIALEIDREILNDLIQDAKAGTYYWSRRPGRFVDRGTGADISSFSNESLLGADFTGTVSEWYETLIETINDVSAAIHRKVLRGGANFVVVGPETANLLEFTSGFRAAVTHGDEKGTIGGLKAGSLSKKFDVYVDPYFPRNLVLVGRNGSSFLESGYVYAPYVPLQVTPTIFGTEDFVPRKGVLTRYAKKMVRPDMYGLVVIKDFLG